MSKKTDFEGGNLSSRAIDWQQCFMSTLWRLLPEGNKSIMLTSADWASLVDAFLPGGPTMTVTSSAGGLEITFRICSIEEAVADAGKLGIDVKVPGVAGLQ